MKLLYVLRSEPDDRAKALMDIASEGKDTTIIKLYEANVNYEELVDLLFEHDRVFTW